MTKPIKYLGKMGDDGEYADFSFAKHIRQHVTLWLDRDTGKWAGVMQLSLTDDGDFLGSRDLPAKLLRKIVALIPAADMEYNL